MKTLGKTPQPQHGIGLIEVLVTILLLAVGLLGMSKIHGLLIRDGGTANNRALAISLAQQKLDDLRSFKWIDPARSSGQNCDSGVFCYSEIANNLGGLEEDAGTLKLPSGDVTVGPTTFNRTWTVTTNTAPDFKVVTVTVTWTDPNGAASEVLTSTVAAEDPNVTAFGAAGLGGGGDGPKASYTAQGTPDVVPVQIDTAGASRETSKPLPDVSSKALSVATQFASVNYDSSGQQTQEDFKTVSCRCQYAAEANANPAAYYTYTSGSLVVKYPSSPSVNKWTGSAITSQGDSQDPLCDACCKDHHDSQVPGVTTPTTALFDPDRPDTDYHTGGDHKHYYFSNAASPNLGLVEVAQSSGNNYLEACRFLRVDGIYRIMQDWRLSAVTVLPQDNYLQVADKLTAYQSYIEGVVKGQAKTDGGADTSLGAAPTDRDLTNLSAGYRQLLARGIYVDRVYSASQPRTKDDAYYTGVINETIGINSIPFNEVNVTLLANWFSSNTSVATVANDDILDITAASSDYYGVYNRGRVNVLSGSGNNSDITAYMLPSNSGLTAGATRATYSSTVDYPTGTIAYSSEIGIDPNDHGTAQRKSSTINIARAGGSTTRTVSGTIRKGNYSADLTSGTLTIGATGVTCSIDAPTGNTTSFSCLVDSFTGDLALSTSQSGAFFENSTCTVLPSSDTCGVFTVFGPLMYVSGSCSGQGQSCGSRNLTIVTSAGTTCTTGSSPQCPVPVTGSQRTWTGTITVRDTTRNAKVDIDASGTLSCTTIQETKTLSVGPVGPADAPSSFVMCVK